MSDLVLIHSPPPVLPALIAAAGAQAAWRFLEFFRVNIHNPNTRAAYTHAAAAFLLWCDGHGLRDLARVQPIHVAAYIEELGRVRSAPTVKQHLACIRMLFAPLVTGQIVPANPAHAVRGPRHSVSKGTTPVLTSEEARALLAGMNVSSVVGLRDRAIIAVMTYSFARVSAVVGLKVEDYFPQRKHWWLRLREKNGRVTDMPCHPKLAVYLDDYIDAADIAGDRRGALFRAVIVRKKSALDKKKRLSTAPLTRKDVWCMVRRRAANAGIETPIGCHSFRATGITDYLSNGGRLEMAQRMAGHANAKTTGLYDRRSDDVDLSEVARIGI